MHATCTYTTTRTDHVLSATRVAATGADRSHGQLIILGYREFIVQGTAWHPRGKLNDRLVLKTRAEPNGLKFTPGSAPVLPDEPPADVTSATGTTVTSGSGGVSGAVAEPAEQHVAYAPDAFVDMYQVGRLDCPENDFCVKGMSCALSALAVTTTVFVACEVSLLAVLRALCASSASYDLIRSFRCQVMSILHYRNCYACTQLPLCSVSALTIMLTAG
jgi:hypothetical protein